MKNQLIIKMKKSKLNSFVGAYNEKFKYYDDNTLMLSWYVARLLNKLNSEHQYSFLSLGIGQEIVTKNIINSINNRIYKYTIVEGSSEIIKKFILDYNLPETINIVNDLFETFQPNEKFDVIEMGFILEHVENPEQILRKYMKFLNPNGVIFIAVPNATSLHRRVGKEANLLSDMYQLSEYDQQEGHLHYFDLNSLKNLVINVGLNIVRCEGIFLKPITTSQIKKLNLSKRILDGFCHVGIEYPELSNGIFLEARLSK